MRVNYQAIGILSSVILYYISVFAPPSLYFNFFVLLIYFLGVYSVFSKEAKSWLYFPYLYSISGSLISCFLIEVFEIYLIEVEELGFLSGATVRAGLLSILFLLMCDFSLKILEASVVYKKIKTRAFSNFEKNVFWLFFYCAVFYLFFGLLYSGSPLFLAASRFDYFHSDSLPGYRLIYTTLPFMMLFISLIYIDGSIALRNMFFCHFLVLMIMVFTGEKFSLYLDAFFYSILPFWVCGYSRLKHNMKYYVAIVFIILVLSVGFNYVRRGDELTFLFVRMALQGQMIFALDTISLKVFEFDFLKLALSFLGLASDAKDVGMYHLMYQIAPQPIVDRMVDYGMSFTAPFPANFQYFFLPTYAPLFIIYAAVLVAFAIFVLKEMVQNGKFFGIFCSAILFHYISVAILMGKTERFLHPITIIAFILVALLFVRRGVFVR